MADSSLQFPRCKTRPTAGVSYELIERQGHVEPEVGVVGQEEPVRRSACRSPFLAEKHRPLELTHTCRGEWI
jgi:hypothetical protein